VRQHAYQRGKSTESALLELVNSLGRALDYKEVAPGSFLDIAGAFDNTTLWDIVEALEEKTVDPTTIRRIKGMLTQRKIRAFGSCWPVGILTM
jgi:hypothetical protein